MDWLEFIAKILSSISWPLVILLIVIIFKSELSNVVKRVAHVKYKDFDIAFEDIKKQAEVMLVKTHHEPHNQAILPTNSVINKSLKDQVFSTVDLAPQASVLLAWSSLEAAIASTVARLSISPDSPSYRSAMHNIDMLSNYTDISPRLINLMNELRKLRNEIAHDNVNLSIISSSQAEDYAKVAYDIIENLENIKYKAPDKSDSVS